MKKTLAILLLVSLAYVAYTSTTQHAQASIDTLSASHHILAGYRDWYALMLYYVYTWHKRTLPDIVRTYAPPSENDTNGYITAVERSVDTWRAGSEVGQ